MIVESGIIIFLGLVLIAIKLPTRKLLWVLGYPVATDLIVSVVAFVMHYGTFSGVMAAAVAGLMTSCLTAGGRKAVGYIEKGTYYPGYWTLDPNKKETKQ